MNDHFNLTRFGWVFRKSILERPVQMLGLLCLTLTITILTYSILQSNIGIVKAQGTAFAIGLIGGGSYMATTVFGYFFSNASGSSFLMLPASNLEKWLCGVLVTGLLFTLVYLGFYRILDMYFVNHFRNSLDPTSPSYRNMYQSVELLNFDSSFCRITFVIFANIAGAMLVGSLYFNKVSFIKVALIICILLITIYYVNMMIASMFFDNIDMAIPYKTLFLKVGNEVGVLSLPASVDKAVFIIMSSAFPAILWGLAYLRIVEKEI